MSLELVETDEQKKLTLKQRLFIEAYLGEANGNGVQSAKIAGYSGDDHQLSVIAAQNLAKLSINSRVEQRVSEAALTADEVLKELALVGMLPLDELDPKLANSKVRALELLGKYHKLFTDKVETKDTTVKSEAEKKAELDKLYEDQRREMAEKVIG